MKNHIRKLIPNFLRNWGRKFLGVKRTKKLPHELEAIENEIRKSYGGCFDERCAPVFIIASPRTGSTLLYQLICKYLKVSYYSNGSLGLCNYPLLAWILSNDLTRLGRYDSIVGNWYGETFGLSGPSEASEIFSNWFNHVHPSELMSNNFVSPKAKDHMRQTFSLIQRISGFPVVTKNAWNCFRLDALSEAFPNAKFVYLRRNIVDSSYSTLLARKKQGDPNLVWNSASPASYHRIRQLPYYQQVVEQQYRTNMTVQKFLNRNHNNLTIYYENLLENPAVVLEKISAFCKVGIACTFDDLRKEVKPPNGNLNMVDPDWEKIKIYCNDKVY